VTLALEANSPHIGLTVTDCRGFGRNRARERSTNTDVGDYKSKLRLEAAVAGRIRALAVARLIARLAHTGRPGDGKVLLTRLAGAVAIRDFSLDAAAL
jgi:nitrogen regulatory protein PII